MYGSVSVQVIAPSVRAFLYTWGGRKTAEGEKIPVRIEELDIGYIDGMLLLPLVVEHGIDERSPLYGHTYESLRVCCIRLGVMYLKVCLPRILCSCS